MLCVLCPVGEAMKHRAKAKRKKRLATRKPSGRVGWRPGCRRVGRMAGSPVATENVARAVKAMDSSHGLTTSIPVIIARDRVARWLDNTLLAFPVREVVLLEREATKHISGGPKPSGRVRPVLIRNMKGAGMAKGKKGRKGKRMHGEMGVPAIAGKSKRRRGRRMSGAAGIGGAVIEGLSVLGGAVGAALITPRLPLPEKIRFLAPLGLGVALVAMFGRNPLMRSVGIGSIVTGGLSGIRTVQPGLPMLGAATDAEELLGIPALTGEELLGIAAIAGADDDGVGGDDGDDGVGGDDGDDGVGGDDGDDGVGGDVTEGLEGGVPAVAGAARRRFVTAANL